MSRVEVVVSDFGGVLTTPLMQAFAAVQEESGIPWEQFGAGMARAAELAGAQPLFELERGAISEAEFVRQLDAGMRDVLGREVTLHGFGERLFAALHPNAQLIDFMRDLRGRGYRMAILTNNVREWEARWRAMLPIDEIFELVIDSAFVGMRKPEPEIYQLLLERLGVEAAATVFIDDLEVNCDAARALGMNAVHFQSNEQAIAEVESVLDGGSPPAAA
ncbi:HAD family phosphatase [Conexibacter sp. JD483]|uniref:HAD family hydrolase n=1 Tax=unclassified Conexibacter TaxID=2627773 RepID=UPI0027181354|nr:MULTISPECIES: HAD family phosphatase [unclassified Conexibacter]MDO8188040.1 HAD family phosphatase [Conexibacter sp. CPCC 205706]MDO8200462.1 HAD family phosphatase [Conexibacter sp. CPCC 205762]MDR9369809.1 HAD family phosphatase [Conexibacter sp. JD483]